MQVKVSVIGYLNNKVAVYNALVEISEPSFQRGCHHDDAVELAEEAGYSAPFLTVAQGDDMSVLQSIIEYLK